MSFESLDVAQKRRRYSDELTELLKRHTGENRGLDAIDSEKIAERVKKARQCLSEAERDPGSWDKLKHTLDSAMTEIRRGLAAQDDWGTGGR